MKMRFFTKFDLPDRQLREFDRHDNVDRLSYCDNTLMIQRFMEAGKNLKYTRGQALYKSSDVSKDSPVSPMPVYAQDPVETTQQIANVQDVINSQIALLNTQKDFDLKRSESSESSKVQPSSMSTPDTPVDAR